MVYRNDDPTRHGFCKAPDLDLGHCQRDVSGLLQLSALLKIPQPGKKVARSPMTSDVAHKLRVSKTLGP